MENSRCQICKKPGHTAAQCKFNKNRTFKKTYRFKGTCNNCGRRGHKKADCWLLESNAHKRPQGWKRPNNNDLGGTSMEYILMTGEEQSEDEDTNKVVYDIVQWHNKINLVDPEEGEEVGTCDHCGANGMPDNFCHVCKKGEIGDSEDWDPKPLGWCSQCGEEGYVGYYCNICPKEVAIGKYPVVVNHKLKKSPSKTKENKEDEADDEEAAESITNDTKEEAKDNDSKKRASIQVEEKNEEEESQQAKKVKFVLLDPEEEGEVKDNKENDDKDDSKPAATSDEFVLLEMEDVEDDKNGNDEKIDDKMNKD